MCTVTFIARKRGYCLGMNRDEKLTRPTALPPRKRTVNGRAVLAPSEPGAGTWIALNDQDATLALTNWYSIKSPVDCIAKRHREPAHSRHVCNARMLQQSVTPNSTFRHLAP